MKKLLSMIVFVSGLVGFSNAQTTNVDTLKKNVQKKEIRQERSARKHVRGQHKSVAAKSPEEIAKAKTESLDKQLKFSEQQKNDVYNYQLKKVKQWKANAEVRKEDRKARMQEMKTDREEFEKLLTTEQKEILEKKAEERRLRMSKRSQKGFKRGRKPVYTKPVQSPVANSSENEIR